MSTRVSMFLCGVIFTCHGAIAGAAEEPIIRVGIVGCDTSHIIAFTSAINDPKATGALAKCQVTVAYPGGSPDLAASRDRLDGYVQQLRERGISIVDSLKKVADESDAILLESVDGRVHLEQFRAIARGKPETDRGTYLGTGVEQRRRPLLCYSKLTENSWTPRAVHGADPSEHGAIWPWPTPGRVLLCHESTLVPSSTTRTASCAKDAACASFLASLRLEAVPHVKRLARATTSCVRQAPGAADIALRVGCFGPSAL